MTDGFDNLYAKLVKIYTEFGYPQELIGQWTLPRRDAHTLTAIIRACQPRNILEVGTFVGITTLLLARLSPENTQIHSIDPNFPLETEMASMNSKLYDFDTSIRAQELALKAARKLGVDKKITFHEGGFATGNTFASYNTSPASRIAVVGPEVCKAHGPFDFIFIDGLHYEDDVYADLSLAADHLTPRGAMVIHDVLGRWGSNVRRGVFRFLEDRPDYHLTHDNFAKLYETLGILRRHSGDQEGHLRQIDEIIKTGSLFEEKLWSNLAVMLVNKFSPVSVAQIGGDFAFLEKMKELGVPTACGYSSSPREMTGISVPVKVLKQNEKDNSGEKYDLCLCFDVFDDCSHESCDDLIKDCVSLSDTIIWGASPPGEMGNYQRNNKPIAYWVGKFFEQGYLFFDVIRPLLEPHVEATFAESQQNSSYLMNLYLVRKEPALVVNSEQKKWKEIIKNKESRVEDLQLQNLYQRCIIDHERQLYRKTYLEYCEMNQKYREMCCNFQALNEELKIINVFHRKVIHNTIKRTKEVIHKYISCILKTGANIWFQRSR